VTLPEWSTEDVAGYRARIGKAVIPHGGQVLVFRPKKSPAASCTDTEAQIGARGLAIPRRRAAGSPGLARCSLLPTSSAW